MLFAGLDLGTYLFRFILVQKNPRTSNKFDIVKSDTIVINFGVMEPGKMIDAPVLARLEKAFHKVKEHVSSYENVTLRCVGTAALRYSPMASEVIENISRKFGIHVEVISPGEEIYLSSLGCLKFIENEAIVIDVGSGSTELAYVIRTQEGVKVKDYVSLNLGLLNNLSNSRTREEEFAKLGEFANRYKNMPIICSKCSTLKIAYNYFHRKNHAQLNGKILAMSSLKTSLNEFYRMKNDVLKGIPGIGIRQIKLVKVGLPWVYEVLNRLKCSQVMLCEYGLKEGIVIDLMHRFQEEKPKQTCCKNLCYKNIEKDNDIKICKQSYAQKLHENICKWISLDKAK